jgi:nucleotide-binding universal stress UspA family protein
MNLSKNKILVAVDFEEQSMHALTHSYELARLFDADLLLLYVIESISVLGKLRSPDEYVKNLIAQAHEKFDELENLAHSAFLKSSLKVTALIEKGKPYDKILETAVDQNVLMIVMGKNSNTSMRKNRRIVGSNSLNVIREAHCPVITITAGTTHNGKFSRILLPLDFTRQTKRQVQKAIEFGGYFGSRINIISILKKENTVNKLLKQVQLKQVKNAIQKNGIECQTDFIMDKEGEVAEIVLKYSERIEADLIIIMTQQKQNMIDFYIGSTAQTIISNSEIPVLSINPTAKFSPGVVASMVDPLGLINDTDNIISGLEDDQ